MGSFVIDKSVLQSCPRDCGPLVKFSHKHAILIVPELGLELFSQSKEPSVAESHLRKLAPIPFRICYSWSDLITEEVNNNRPVKGIVNFELTKIAQEQAKDIQKGICRLTQQSSKFLNRNAQMYESKLASKTKEGLDEFWDGITEKISAEIRNIKSSEELMRQVEKKCTASNIRWLDQKFNPEIQLSPQFMPVSGWAAHAYYRIKLYRHALYAWNAEKGNLTNRTAAHNQLDICYVAYLFLADGIVSRDKKKCEIARIMYPKKQVLSSLE